jgi:hypothetical protein
MRITPGRSGMSALLELAEVAKELFGGRRNTLFSLPPLILSNKTLVFGGRKKNIVQR